VISLSILYVGKNGNDYEMDRALDDVVHRLLGRLTGEAVKLVPSSGQQCRRWAALLRNNHEKIRLLRYKMGGTELIFEIVDGEDAHQLFTQGRYKRHGKWIDIYRLELTPTEPLDEYRKTDFLEFSDFLDSCGGLVPPKKP
jgi:hypothetical protein